jgi:hypothetical protein
MKVSDVSSGLDHAHLIDVKVVCGIWEDVDGRFTFSIVPTSCVLIVLCRHESDIRVCLV